jgi:hypothetical protein
MESQLFADSGLNATRQDSPNLDQSGQTAASFCGHKAPRQVAEAFAAGLTA